jgi:hypothetical protein
VPSALLRLLEWIRAMQAAVSTRGVIDIVRYMVTLLVVLTVNSLSFVLCSNLTA